MKHLRTLCFCILFFSPLVAEDDPLPSWNEGTTKQAITDFVEAVTDPDHSQYLEEKDRIATFDQDGTLWVEQPLYTQFIYCLDRLKIVANDKPELKEVEPYKSIIAGDIASIDKLTLADWKNIIAVTLAGMSVETFTKEAKAWLATAKHPRWDRPYKELAYQPMLELLSYLRENGFKTYIVTGGGQDFVRIYAQEVYGIPPEQIIGSAGVTQFRYNKEGEPELIKLGELIFNDNYTGKPEGIHLMIGKRPIAAFGNSDGDQQMLEYTQAGKGRTLMMLVLHNDAEREYAYGPAQGLPDTKVGTFTQELYDESTKKSWTVIRMKEDWNKVFSFDES